MIDPFLESNMKQIEESCIKHNVVYLYAFGSVVDGRFKKGISDIDMLVEFDCHKSNKENAKKFTKTLD